MILSKLVEKHESKYTKFWVIDEILESEYYNEEILSDSKDDMVEWALVGYVGAIDDPYTVYLKEEDNTELMNVFNCIKDNILDKEVNMSRFKVTLKDVSIVDKEGITKLGAKGIVEIDNQLKIIFGSDNRTLMKYINEMK